MAGKRATFSRWASCEFGMGLWRSFADNEKRVPASVLLEQENAFRFRVLWV
jgi:hypothetical protein